MWRLKTKEEVEETGGTYYPELRDKLWHTENKRGAIERFITDNTGNIELSYLKNEVTYTFSKDDFINSDTVSSNIMNTSNLYARKGSNGEIEMVTESVLMEELRADAFDIYKEKEKYKKKYLNQKWWKEALIILIFSFLISWMFRIFLH